MPAPNEPILTPGIRYRVAPPGMPILSGVLIFAGIDAGGNPSHLWLEPPVAAAPGANGPVLVMLGPGTLVWPVPPGT